MTGKRWLRIIPVALIMYTISFVDRTNVSLALDGRISSMLRDLQMSERMKGAAAGIFFIGYLVMQPLGGYISQRWSPRKLISVCLVLWGICAMICGLVHTFLQFEVARFFFGMAEGSVFPATVVLLASWFPQAERVRANALWCLCQPMAIVVSAPATGWLLGAYGWRWALILEGLMPFLWLPLWWFMISDRPREAKWLPAEEREFLERSAEAEVAALEPARAVPLWRVLLRWEVFTLIVVAMLYSSAGYGCMTFFTTVLKERDFSARTTGVLFAIPYLLAVVAMILNSWDSDRTQERPGHVGVALLLSGVCLILSVALRGHFWLSYACMCLAIAGPSSAMGPFFAIPSETFPRSFLGPLIGTVNAFGSLGGFIGPFFIGWLADIYLSTAIPFTALGVGMLAAGALAFLLPRTKRTWD